MATVTKDGITYDTVDESQYDYNTKATSAAETAKTNYITDNLFRIDALNSAHAQINEAASIRQQNLIDQIRRQAVDVNDQFVKDVQANRINEQRERDNAATTMAQQGLMNTGFSLGNLTGISNQFANNYNNLVTEKNKDLQDISNQEVDATAEYNAAALEREAAQATESTELQTAINKEAENKYENEREYIADILRKQQADIDAQNNERWQQAYNDAKLQLERDEFNWQKEYQQQSLNLQWASYNLQKEQSTQTGMYYDANGKAVKDSSGLIGRFGAFNDKNAAFAAVAKRNKNAKANGYKTLVTNPQVRQVYDISGNAKWVIVSATSKTYSDSLYNTLMKGTGY